MALHCCQLFSPLLLQTCTLLSISTIRLSPPPLLPLPLCPENGHHVPVQRAFTQQLELTGRRFTETISQHDSFVKKLSTCCSYLALFTQCALNYFLRGAILYELAAFLYQNSQQSGLGLESSAGWSDSSN